MLSRAESASLLADGRCAARRAEFRAAASEQRAWQLEHAASLDDLLRFLTDLQAVFGPFPSDRPITLDSDIRL